MTSGPLTASRVRHGWTLQDLADRCEAEGVKVSITQLGKIERGVHSPRVRLRAVLGRLLELDDSDLPAAHVPGRNGDVTDRLDGAIHRQTEDNANVGRLIDERLHELRDDEAGLRDSKAERQRQRDKRRREAR